MTVRDLILAQAQARPDAVYALATEGSTRLTYARLAQACGGVASVLQRHGVGRGDTVSLVMPNGCVTLEVLLGAMACGCTVNPVNLLSQPEQMAYVLAHSDCKLVFTAPEWTARGRELLANISRPIALVEVDPEGAGFRMPGAALPAHEPQADDLALLMYTSGTTGRPKGVMLTQGNLAANARAIAAEHALTPQDRVLGVLPLYHINAFAVTMLAPLASGGSVAVAPRFSAQRFWSQAIESRCTWINVVPTIIAFLLEGGQPPRDMLSRIRFCRSASAALSPAHLRAFEKRFGIGVIETMGLTETVAPSFSNPLDPAQRRIGSVGRACGGEARVIDAEGRPAPDGTSGEIAVRGPHVMRGYYKNPEATAAAFTADGWLRTGDLGHRDAEGFFFVTGRIKELIIKGGENIAPREIDEVLLRHPAVLDAAAVGMPDEHYGQEILAGVVLREGQRVEEAALRAFCEQHLGRYKTPKVFRFLPELPRGPSGKVQRLKLLDDPAPG
jgi:acyl-CoA synthetase (AMP-forming)/AMP-acid ligase II